AAGFVANGTRKNSPPGMERSTSGISPTTMRQGRPCDWRGRSCRGGGSEASTPSVQRPRPDPASGRRASADIRGRRRMIRKAARHRRLETGAKRNDALNGAPLRWLVAFGVLAVIVGGVMYAIRRPQAPPVMEQTIP